MGKRFFLVLDDVWNENPSLWHTFLLPLQTARSGKILVTTRSIEVASMVQTMPSYNVGPLSPKDSWSLFMELAFGNQDLNENREKVEIGRKIVSKLRGVPLVTKVIGRTGVEKWKEILNSGESDPFSSTGILAPLKLSYDYLPTKLKMCFDVFALFPKNYAFTKGNIINLWMSLGLLELNNLATPEDIGYQYFDDLLNRAMIEEPPFGERPGNYILHDVMHELAQSVAGIYFSREVPENLSMISENVRYLSVVVNKIPKTVSFDPLLHQKSLRILNIVNATNRWNNCIGIEIHGEQIQNFKYLRALDFSHTGIETLPDSIGSLKLLRYLNLTRTKIKRLPECISNLCSLQTLELRECPLEKLPEGINNLVSLRHLNVWGKDICMTHGIGRLTNLQTLPIFNIRRGGWHCQISELKNLVNLRGELTITGLRNVLCVRDVEEADLQSKKHLEDLTLHWSGGPCQLCTENEGSSCEQNADFALEEQMLESLQPHTWLKVLQIHGYSGSRFPRWLGDSSFSSLVEIILSGCGEICEVLPTLGLLPCLKSLSILWMYSVQRVGREFCTNDVEMKGFQSLEILEFKYMPNWVEWFGVKDGEFCLLQTLRIVCCRELRFLPQPLSSSLTRLLLSNCKELSTIPLLPSLDRLTLSGELNEALFSNLHLPSLKSLKIASSENTISIPLTARDLPSLEVLIIKGCKYLECIVGIRDLASLKILKFIRCRSLQLPCSEGIPPLLRQLTVVKCPWLREWHQVVTSRYKHQLCRGGGDRDEQIGEESDQED